MPEYLTKEEIRQWRSSLEKITLEDYAKKLGKAISEEKETNDIVDIIMKDSKTARYISNEEPMMAQYSLKAEKIGSLAQRSFDREKELDIKRTLKKVKKESQKSIVKDAKKTAKQENKKSKISSLIREEVQLTFKKNLTPREQAVFEHFLNHKNSIVYAKELAQILELPRDYVYKYIKNLRTKLNEDAIRNSDNGGFILEIK
jgi:hypothetical protein